MNARFSLTPCGEALVYTRRQQRMLLRSPEAIHHHTKRAVAPDQRMGFDCDEPEATTEELEELERLRPRTRGDCERVPRPCPFVGCRQHLFLSVRPVTGGIAYHHTAPWDMAADRSCALDLAEQGGMDQPDVADALGDYTHQAVDLAETHAVRTVERRLRRLGVID